MQTQRRFWKGFQQYHVVNVVVRSYIVAALVLYFANFALKIEMKEVHIQRAVLSSCALSVSLESVPSRKLSTLPTRALSVVAKSNVAQVAAGTRIRQSDADLNLLSTSQRCVPRRVFHSDHNPGIAYKMLIAANASVVSAVPNGSHKSARQVGPAIRFVSQKSTPPFNPIPSASHNFLDLAEPLSVSLLQGSANNVFPFGQCTWWANQRYHQLHGSFVPWRTNANAFQWVARAADAGWRVSGTPMVGSIVVLQPDVEGAQGLGHVGVVEQVLTDGRVIASSMNCASLRAGVIRA